MEKQYIIVLIWLAGFICSRWMLKVEHKAEGLEVTYGDVVMKELLSIASWAMVLLILVKAWTQQVKSYWKQQVTTKKAK